MVAIDIVVTPQMPGFPDDVRAAERLEARSDEPDRWLDDIGRLIDLTKD